MSLNNKIYGPCSKLSTPNTYLNYSCHITRGFTSTLKVDTNFDYFLGFTGIMDQTPVKDNNVPVPISPRTPTAKCDQLGFLYGSPITSLPAGRKPTKSEVVQLYMHLYDQVLK